MEKNLTSQNNGAVDRPPTQVSLWKKQALENMKEKVRRGKAKKKDEALKDELYGQIGRMKVELDWLKKAWSYLLRRSGAWWVIDDIKK